MRQTWAQRVPDSTIGWLMVSRQNTHIQPSRWFATYFAPTLVAAVVLFSSCSFGGPAKIDVEFFDTGQNPGLMQTVEGGFWVLVDGDSESTEFVFFEDESDDITRRVRFGFVNHSAILFGENTVHLRSLNVIEGIPQAETITPGDQDDPISHSIIKFDLESEKPIVQYPLAARQLVPWYITERGFFWYVDSDGMGRIDLQTGEHESFQAPPGNSLLYTDGYLWMFHFRGIDQFDEQTGELVERYPVDLDHSVFNYRPYDDKFWIFGPDEDGVLVETEFDPATLTVTPPVGPAPREAIDTGDHRWECCYGARENDPEATWIWIDNETEEELGRYRFDGYTPMAEYNGYLWLSSEAGLGRVPLDVLETR